MHNHQHDYPYLAEYYTPPPTVQQPAPPVDWDNIAEVIPPLVALLSWLLWALFLLIPSIFGLHDAPLFSTANNVVFVAMGFVLCMAISSAIRSGHGARAIFFLMGLSLLSFWF